MSVCVCERESGRERQPHAACTTMPRHSQAAVPTALCCVATVLTAIRASPKSASLALPSAVSSTFDGLRSTQRGRPCSPACMGATSMELTHAYVCCVQEPRALHRALCCCLAADQRGAQKHAGRRGRHAAST